MKKRMSAQFYFARFPGRKHAPGSAVASPSASPNHFAFR
jgi:hypothetical protein